MLINAAHLFPFYQYSDLAEAERALVLDGFRHSTLHWNQSVVVQSGNDIKAVEDVEQKSHIVVVTDACLPLLTSGESPLSARVLINYELPTKKVQSFIMILKFIFQYQIKFLFLACTLLQA